VKGMSSCHARLRVEQEVFGRPQLWPRFHDQNYIKLDTNAEPIRDRSLELRGIGSADSYSVPWSSFMVTLEVPVTGPDSLNLQKDADGTAYITIGRIIPVKKRGLLTNKTLYRSYSGHAFQNDLPQAKVDRLESWLKECYQSHSFCSIVDNIESIVMFQTKKSSNLPGFTLIDAITEDVVPASLGMAYAALSYVWGNGAAGTREENQNSNSDTGRSRYPRTIRDALVFTVLVGLRYLWIDAVCVPAEDSQRAEQILQMDAIYDCATVVIIAASSEHSDFGLHGISLEQKPQVRTRFNQLELVFRPYDYADHLAMSEWSARGWCLREGLLAHRRFIITDREVFFECRENIYHESKADSGVSKVGDSILNVMESVWTQMFRGQVGTYGDIVTSYLRRELTFESDFVDAFTGLANSFSLGYIKASSFKPQQTQSCWGLPCRYFGPALTWSPILTGSPILTEVHPPRRRNLSLKDCAIPSWSWMAWRIKGIEYTRRMRLEDDVFPKFTWSNEIRSAAVKTGLIEFEAEVVSFQDGIEEVKHEDDLDYELSPSWARGKGSFLSMTEWKGYPDSDKGLEGHDLKGHTHGRFVLRIKKMGDVIYRIGHEVSIPEDEWEKRGPLQMRVNLG